jgi:hypothetical protein
MANLETISTFTLFVCTYLPTTNEAIKSKQLLCPTQSSPHSRLSRIVLCFDLADASRVHTTGNTSRVTLSLRRIVIFCTPRTIASPARQAKRRSTVFPHKGCRHGQLVVVPLPGRWGASLSGLGRQDFRDPGPPLTSFRSQSVLAWTLRKRAPCPYR